MELEKTNPFRREGDTLGHVSRAIEPTQVFAVSLYRSFRFACVANRSSAKYAYVSENRAD